MHTSKINVTLIDVDGNKFHHKSTAEFPTPNPSEDDFHKLALDLAKHLDGNTFVVLGCRMIPLRRVACIEFNKGY